MREALAYNQIQDEEGMVDRGREAEFATQLEALLERLNPEKVTPTWINKNAPGLYVHLLEALSNVKGRYDWSPVISRLDKKWQNRWSSQKRVEGERGLQDEVDALDLLLEIEQPETFGPQWICEHDAALKWRLSKKACDNNGKLDWTIVIDLLDEKWRKRWFWKKRVERGRTLEDEMAELSKLLELERPDVISPNWIRDHDKQLYFRLVSRIEDKSGKRDWSRMVALLGDEWRLRWKLEKGEKVLDLKTEVDALKALLEEENPNTVSPLWIRRKDGTLYKHLLKVLNDEQGGHDWSRVTTLLDDKWRERWSNEIRVGREWSLKDGAKEVNALLEAENPLSITPAWIGSRDLVLYGRLKRRLSSMPRDAQGGLDWRPFIALLDKNWQNCWLTQEQVAEKALLRDIESLREILEVKKPDFFSPKWIEKNAQNIYQHLSYRIRSSGGLVDWAKIVSMLDKKWADKWSFGASETDKRVPKHQYADEEEVNRVFERYKNKLYTLVSLFKPEDKQARDMIHQELVALAQKGNTSAEERLMDFLIPLVQEWMDEHEDFSVYKNDPERVYRILKRCIYLSKRNVEIPFVGYVYSSLKMGAIGLKHQIARSLDRSLNDEDERNLHDFLTSPSLEED